MFKRHDTQPGLKVKYYPTIAVDMDLKALGGMGTPAREIRVAGAGDLTVVNDIDSSQETLTFAAGDPPLPGFFRQLKLDGTTATKVTVVW